MRLPIRSDRVSDAGGALVAASNRSLSHPAARSPQPLFDGLALFRASKKALSPIWLRRLAASRNIPSARYTPGIGASGWLRRTKST